MTAVHDPRRRAFDTRGGFVAAVHEALDAALARRARRMLWVDADFADWPLDDAALLQRLGDWLRLPQRHLRLLVGDDRDLRRRRARFMACYRLWSHAVEASAALPEAAAPLPCVLLAEGTVLVQLQDKPGWRGWTTTDPAAMRACGEQIDVLLQRSDPALPVTTLGL